MCPVAHLCHCCMGTSCPERRRTRICYSVGRHFPDTCLESSRNNLSKYRRCHEAMSSDCNYTGQHMSVQHARTHCCVGEDVLISPSPQAVFHISYKVMTANSGPCRLQRACIQAWWTDMRACGPIFKFYKKCNSHNSLVLCLVMSQTNCVLW